MFDAILFDKDGTLTDFQATWGEGTRGIFAAIAGDDDAAKRAMGTAIGFEWDTGVFVPGSVGVTGPERALLDQLASVMTELPRQDLEARYYASVRQVEQQPAVDLAPFFRDLSARGYLLGVVTNDNEASARRHMEQFGVLEHLKFLVGADSGFGAKPAPGQLLAFTEATGVAPERTLMVGDTLHDLHAAEAAGMPAVAVLTGASDAAHLAPHARAVLPDIGHLPGWLGQDEPFAT